MKVHTYRDELREKDPSMVSDWRIGGAYGCPGEHFIGAPCYEPCKCSPVKEKRCRACWGQPYAQERWSPGDKDWI